MKLLQNSEYQICWVEEKKEKGRILFESVHCHSPTPPFERRRPKNTTTC